MALIMILTMSASVFAEDDSLTGRLYILHSNDVHGAIDGYAKMAAFRDELVDQGAEVLLVDAGDYSQGKVEVSYSKGADAVTLMNAVGYDVVVLGNHEFDYGYTQLKSNMDSRTFTLITNGVFEGGAPLFDGVSTKVEKGGMTIGFVGVETPETQTKVNPAMITELSFLTDSTSPTLFEAVQDAVDGVSDADLVIAVTHLGVDPESEPYRSIDMCDAVTGVDFVIDAHSHSVMTEGSNGEPIQSTGTAFANIGVIVIDLESKTIVDHYLKPVDEIEGNNEEVAAIAQGIHDKVNSALGEVFATSEVDLNGDKAPGNRNQETNNGDLITDAMMWKLTEANPGSITEVPEENIVAITNGGGIRAWIHQGDITMKDVNTVLPFGNTLTVVYVKGSELLEALEASTYCTPEAVGGFPQIAGMNISIDTTKEYDANEETYPGSTYHGPASINRVTIKDVNGQPFDPDATYAVITNNFVSAGGDTYYVFTNASSQFDTGEPLDEVVMQYISDKLEGVITTEQYAEPQGRIEIITEAQEEPEPEDPVSPPTHDNMWIYSCAMIISIIVIGFMPAKRKEY